MVASNVSMIATGASAPFNHAAAYLGSSDIDSTLTLCVRASSDIQPALAKMSRVCLKELHLIVEEEAQDQPVPKLDHSIAKPECDHNEHVLDRDEELMRIYQLLKQCKLLGHRLESFAVTYHAHNSDDSHNSIRVMALVGLLNQLDWDLCKHVVLNLHINYLHGDPRLELLEELPVTIHLNGETTCAHEAAMDDAQLHMLSQTYAYLEGAI